MTKRPNIDLIGVEWLKRLDGLPIGAVATRLPMVNGDVDVAKLRTSGFVVWRSGLGGATGSGVRRPVGAAECWAAPAEGSSQIPWGRASDLAEEIHVFASNELSPMQGITMTLPHGYGNVYVHTVRALSEPRKVTGDPSGFARFDVDLEINWRAS